MGICCGVTGFGYKQRLEIHNVEPTAASDVDWWHKDSFFMFFPSPNGPRAGGAKRSIEGCKNLHCMATSPKSSVFA